MTAQRLTASLLLAVACGCGPDMTSIEKSCTQTVQLPVISPDYRDIILPPNIAPLNFTIREPGQRYIVHLSGKRGQAITITSRTPGITIPEKKWRNLLLSNKGSPLHIRLWVRDSLKKWNEYATISDTVSVDPIDPYITYRTLGFLYNYSSDLQIHERHLESFKETTLLNTKNFFWGCTNCHMPDNNDPNRMVVHTRSSDFGSATLLALNGNVHNISAKLGYTSWRPGGALIAFSLSRVRQCFHAVGKNPIDDYDLSSEIFIYDIRKQRILDVPQLYLKGAIQSWPCWSPDGSYLYFCGGPILWSDFNNVPPENFDKQRCSLLRIAYNEQDGTFGTIDTVLSTQQTGLSISQPRVSPDGRFVLFCMHTFGPYPITQASSNLYLLDLSSVSYTKLAISSNESESWHAWSRNGRWIVFSSKRNGGILTRLYFSHIDSNMVAHKPFILPQKDPYFYDSFIKCFNVPELAIAASPYTQRDLLKAIRSSEKIDAPLPTRSATAGVKNDPSAEWSPMKKRAQE